MKENSSLVEKVKETIEKYQMFTSKTRITVGVSGGPDSSALLHLLLRLKDEYRLQLWVAHLNHRLRGKEAEEEAKWVKRFTFALGVPLILDSFDVTALAKRRKLGIEEAARRARYDFLEQVANQVSANKIALGHTASDQAETILMRLMKGTGLDGLSGIPPVRGRIIRPIIEIFRNEIEDYCEKNNLQPCLDSSNRKTSFLRNRIRLNLLPFLSQEFNPQINKILFQMGKILREDADFIKKEGEKKFDMVLKKEGRKKNQRWLILDVEKLFYLHPALQKRVLRQAIQRVKGNLKGINSYHLDSILSLDGEKGVKRVNLPENLVVQRQYQNLLFKRGKFENISFTNSLVIPGKTELTPLNLILETKLLSKESNSPFASLDNTYFPGFITSSLKDKISSGKTNDFPEKEVYFDFDKLEPPLLLRERKKGDKFCPLGMKGFKKIKDFFIDLKLPLEKRKMIPLLVSKDRIAWVVGYRIDERFKVDSNTRRILKIKILER